jgi:hypothetical protein
LLIANFLSAQAFVVRMSGSRSARQMGLDGMLKVPVKKSPITCLDAFERDGGNSRRAEI